MSYRQPHTVVGVLPPIPQYPRDNDVYMPTREFGVRLALGAQPTSLLGMVMRQGLTMVMTGLVLGLAGAVALSRVLANLLFDTMPTDPAIFAIVSLVLLVAALTACFLPARRTMRVDPMAALRTE